MQLNKLLLTGYQFSRVKIPIEYGGRVKRFSISIYPLETKKMTFFAKIVIGKCQQTNFNLAASS